MEYRRLGRAGIKLSTIGLGSWLTYGNGVDDGEARRCIRRAFDLGINFFDTADVYNRGAAESVVGAELKQFSRRDVVIATKCYFPMSDGVNDRGLSRKHIFESAHASLQRLQVETIDLYQCHRFDPDVELFELVRAMDDLVRQGKIHYWGVSEWPADQIARAAQLADELNAAPPVSNQPHYSLAQRRIEPNGVQRACVEHGLGMVVFSPLEQGLLTGKYSGGKAPSDSRAANPKMNAFLKELPHDTLERVDQLRPIANDRGLSLAQLAIAWTLHQPGITSAIVGASRVTQVDENAAAAGKRLDAETLKRMDALFPAK